MAICEHCGNEYDKSFQVIMGGRLTLSIVSSVPSMHLRHHVPIAASRSWVTAINPTRGPITSHMRGPTTSDVHCPMTSDTRGGPKTSDIRSIAATTGSNLLGLTVSKKCKDRKSVV